MFHKPSLVPQTIHSHLSSSMNCTASSMEAAQPSSRWSARLVWQAIPSSAASRCSFNADEPVGGLSETPAVMTLYTASNPGRTLLSWVAAAATKYGRKNGTPIFLEPTTDANGEFCHNQDDGGRLVFSPGEGGQRWQATFEKPRKPVGEGDVSGATDTVTTTMQKYLQKLQLFNELQPVVQCAKKRVEGVAGPGEEVKKVVVLINHPGKVGDPPVGAQAIHTDLPAMAPGFVGFLGLSHYSVLVSPMSHHTIRTYETLKNMNPGAAESEIVRAVSAPKMVRVMIEPGQIVLVHGNTVHAGDAGSLGEWAPRLHFCVMRRRVVDETHPIAPMQPLLAGLFQ